MSRWTNVFEAKLAVLYRDPAKPRIADIMNSLNEACGTDFTFSAVTQRIKHLRLCNRSSPLWDKAREDHLAGMVDGDSQVSCSEMALSLNAGFGLSLTRSAVCGKIKRMKRDGLISDRPRPRQPFDSRKANAGTSELRVVPLEAARPDILITDLADNECRWPVASDGALHFFCGHDRGFRIGADGTKKRLPYCAHHAAAARGVGTSSERAASRVSAAA